MKKTVAPHDYSQLIGDLSSLIEQGRRFAVRYVNTALVVTYWLMGRRIVEYEQKGKKRAEYGETTLRKLADDPGLFSSSVFPSSLILFQNLGNCRTFLR